MSEVYILTRCKDEFDYPEYMGVFSSLLNAQAMVDHEDAIYPLAHSGAEWEFVDNTGTRGAFILNVTYTSPSGRDTYKRQWRIYGELVDYWFDRIKKSP